MRVCVGGGGLTQAQALSSKHTVVVVVVVAGQDVGESSGLEAPPVLFAAVAAERGGEAVHGTRIHDAQGILQEGRK